MPCRCSPCTRKVLRESGLSTDRKRGISYSLPPPPHSSPVRTRSRVRKLSSRLLPNGLCKASVPDALEQPAKLVETQHRLPLVRFHHPMPPRRDRGAVCPFRRCRYGCFGWVATLRDRVGSARALAAASMERGMDGSKTGAVAVETWRRKTASPAQWVWNPARQTRPWSWVHVRRRHESPSNGSGVIPRPCDGHRRAPRRDPHTAHPVRLHPDHPAWQPPG